jgi:hypothetical protein
MGHYILGKKKSGSKTKDKVKAKVNVKGKKK